VLKVAVMLMGAVAVIWLAYEFWRLLWEPEPLGAIDLKQRYTEINAWYSGKKVYEELGTAVYPPASYAILWPFMGSLSWTAARYAWAITTLMGMAWLVYLSIRSSLAETSLERVFIALVPLSIYSTGAAIGNGQPLLHLLPALVAAILLLEQGTSLLRDFAASALFIFALVKPNVAAPFFWIVIVRPGRWRPALFVLTGYLGLTLLAASYQPDTAFGVIRDWTRRAESGVEDTREGVRRAEAGLDQSDASVMKEKPTWIGAATPDLNRYVSILILLGSGFWFYKYRRADLWLLLGVGAFVARFWTYHRWYDDIVLLLPAITLFRIGRQHQEKRVSLISEALLALVTLSLLAPGGLYVLHGMWKAVYLKAQMLIWISVLLFLLWFAWRYPASFTSASSSKTKLPRS
jgi:hypothetical protein